MVHVLVEALARGHGDLVVVPRAGDARAMTGDVLDVAVEERGAHVIAGRVHGEDAAGAANEDQMATANLHLQARVLAGELSALGGELETAGVRGSRARRWVVRVHRGAGGGHCRARRGVSTRG